MEIFEKILAVYSELLKTYPPILTLEEGAKFISCPSVNALRIRFNRKTLPVRLRENGGEQCFSLLDLAEWQVTGEKQEQILPVRQKKPSKSVCKVGRPSKAEQIARREAERMA